MSNFEPNKRHLEKREMMKLEEVYIRGRGELAIGYVLREKEIRKEMG